MGFLEERFFQVWFGPFCSYSYPLELKCENLLKTNSNWWQTRTGPRKGNRQAS